MKRALFLFVSFLMCQTGHAEMLLSEIGWNQPEPVTLPAEYEFGTPSNPITSAVWPITTIHTFPYNDSAAPDVLTAFNVAMTLNRFGAVDVWFDNGGQRSLACDAFTCATHSFNRLL
jgi:hypothetical protein